MKTLCFSFLSHFLSCVLFCGFVFTGRRLNQSATPHTRALILRSVLSITLPWHLWISKRPTQVIRVEQAQKLPMSINLTSAHSRTSQNGIGIQSHNRRFADSLTTCITVNLQCLHSHAHTLSGRSDPLVGTFFAQRRERSLKTHQHAHSAHHSACVPLHRTRGFEFLFKDPTGELAIALSPPFHIPTSPAIINHQIMFSKFSVPAQPSARLASTSQ
mmetsp:Transcript_1203/g.1933  ORF Transcript_1203/g.1933 Transcript_1203/m.1933 type:complete len:216 (-) Transcript_1203:169-816(-)